MADENSDAPDNLDAEVQGVVRKTLGCRIVHMADVANNSKMQTMRQVIERIAADGSASGYSDGLVIMLNRKNGNYDLCWRNAGLSASEGLALLEVMKTVLLHEMGYIE